jgi:tetratricopeptide (TPR) repeat protein
MTGNHLLLYRITDLMLEHEQHILPVDLLFDDVQIGDFEKAIQTISKAIEINKLFNNGINDRLNRDLNNLGVTFAKLGRYNEALPSFIEANYIEEELFDNNPELRIITWLNICKIYLKMGDKSNLKMYLTQINNLPEIVRSDYSSYIQELSKNDH